MFSLLTYNVRKLCGPVPPQRVTAAVLARGADLICCQEVFNTRFPGLGRNARELLGKVLGANGYSTAWLETSGPRVLGAFLDGLLIAVRDDTFELSPERETDYQTAYLSRGLTRRGVQYALVRERRSGRRLAVCNTHLTVGVGARARRRRGREVRRLLDLLRDLERRDVPDAVLLAGDLNALESFEEMRMLTLPTAEGEPPLFQDVHRHLHPEEDGFTLDRERNTILARRKAAGRFEGSARIDYVLLRPPFGAGGPDLVEPVRCEVVLDRPDPESRESLSDHFGLQAWFALR